MPSSSAPGIYSDLADDPDLVELVEMFVEEMPERVARLVATWEARDLKALMRLAHQLKGSAGSYGFHDITPYAQQLESALKCGGSEEAIRRELDEVVAICSQIRSGTPEDAPAQEIPAEMPVS